MIFKIYLDKYIELIKLLCYLPGKVYVVIGEERVALKPNFLFTYLKGRGRA